MPNWFYGNVRVSADSQEKLLPFKEYFSKYEEGPYGEIVCIDQEKGFAETFLPLPGGKWNYANAIDMWGVKWDLKITQIIKYNLVSKVRGECLRVCLREWKKSME
jgi:hypothetical protein